MLCITGQGKLTRAAIAAGLSAVPNHPYSRSHIKREKKKAKQRLAGRDDIESALPDAGEEEEEEEQTLAAQAVAAARDEAVERPKRPKVKEGVIGEGRGLSMKEKKKRKQMYALS